MKIINLLLLVVIIHFNWQALACISFPRTVQLQNSPYFFDRFSIHGNFLEFQMSGGQQNVRLMCNKNDSGINQWFVEADDDLSTPQPDAFPQTQMDQTTTGADGQILTNYITDSSEVPVITRIGPFVSGADAATLNFNNPNSPNTMSLRCIHNSANSMGVGSRVMIVEFKDPQGNIIATVGAEQATGVRGISPNGADAVIDMAHLTPSQINIPGCGGGSLLPARQSTGERVSQ